MSNYLTYDETPVVKNLETTGKVEKGYPTDVEGVHCDDLVKVGKDEFPVFDVPKETFYSNSEFGRKRLRVPSGSRVQQYLQGTKYSRAFYLRTTDDDNKQYIKRVK